MSEAIRYYVVSFYDDGFNEVESRHRTRATAAKAARKLRKAADDKNFEFTVIRRDEMPFDPEERRR